MDLAEAVVRRRYLIRDPDATFDAVFDATFNTDGIRIITSAVRAPRMNSIMERWIKSCRTEILDRTLLYNEQHLLHALREYEGHYNTHRTHRALAAAAPLRALPAPIDLDQVRIRRHDRLGGILHEYTAVA